MAEYWEPIRDRGNATCSIWNQYNHDFLVGQLDIAAHLTDVQAIEGMVQARDDSEDFYDQAVDAKDANLSTLANINVNAVRAIRGNLEAGDALMLELEDVSGMPNVGSGRIMARSRKLTTLWKKVNTARAAATPPLDPLQVGPSLVAALDTALAANEPRLKAVSDMLASWNSARRALKALADKVDHNNKRWYDAWSGNYAPGTMENDALSQIDTGSGGGDLPGEVVWSAMYDGAGHFHIDATAPHATHFRELRKGPGETEFIERAANAESPIQDSVTLPGTYDIKLQGRNSTGDGPMSAVQQVVRPV